MNTPTNGLTEHMTLRIAPEHAFAVGKLAHRAGLGRSQVLRALLRAGLRATASGGAGVLLSADAVGRSGEPVGVRLRAADVERIGRLAGDAPAGLSRADVERRLVAAGLAVVERDGAAAVLLGEVPDPSNPPPKEACLTTAAPPLTWTNPTRRTT